MSATALTFAPHSLAVAAKDGLPKTQGRFVFKNDAAYAPYKRNAGGETMNASGYFQPRGPGAHGRHSPWVARRPG